MVASAFSPSTHLADREADLCEFEASLVYRVSSRTSSKATEKFFSRKKKFQGTLASKAHTYNPYIQETEVGGLKNLKLASAT